jgi:putative tricarboxylic transport membrane protein
MSDPSPRPAGPAGPAGPGALSGRPGRRGDWPDLLFGLFLVAVAAVALTATWKLRGGTASDMGPGYMPRAVALLLLGFGLVFSLRGLRKGGAGVEPVQARPALVVLAAVAIFAGTVESAGLALASLLTIVVAGFASREHRLLEGIVFGVALAAAAVPLFVKVLALPVPVWPW